MHQIRQNARPTSDARRSTSTLVRRTCSSLVDRSDEHARLLSIDECDRQSTRDERAHRSRSSVLVNRDRRSRRSIDDRDRAPRRSSARSFLSLSDLGSLFSLSLSLSFSWSELKWKWRQKWISVVKGKICGQPEIIFRKIMFSVTAKCMHFPEIDFRNWFEVDSNAPLVY